MRVREDGRLEAGRLAGQTTTAGSGGERTTEGLGEMSDENGLVWASKMLKWTDMRPAEQIMLLLFGLLLFCSFFFLFSNKNRIYFKLTSYKSKKIIKKVSLFVNKT